MIRETNMNIYLLSTYRYPWLSDIALFMLCEAYTPLIISKVVRWNCLDVGGFQV